MRSELGWWGWGGGGDHQLSETRTRLSTEDGVHCEEHAGARRLRAARGDGVRHAEGGRPRHPERG